jgi:hypothetical protein
MMLLDALIFLGVLVVGACCWTSGYYTGKLVARTGHK